MQSTTLTIAPVNRLIIFNKYLQLMISALKIVSQLVKFKINGRPHPLILQVQVTKRCNLSCFYCYRDAENIKDKDDMTLQTFKCLIDQASQLGTRWVRLLGGEPLIRNDIGQMVDYVKSKGMLCEMNTNGYFLTQRIHQLTNLDSLVISIDGAEHTHDLCRGKGSYHVAITALDLAKQLKLPLRLQLFNQISSGR